MSVSCDYEIGARVSFPVYFLHLPGTSSKAVSGPGEACCGGRRAGGAAALASSRFALSAASGDSARSYWPFGAATPEAAGPPMLAPTAERNGDGAAGERLLGDAILACCAPPAWPQTRSATTASRAVKRMMVDDDGDCSEDAWTGCSQRREGALGPAP